jgi:hypothetical protein
MLNTAKQLEWDSTIAGSLEYDFDNTLQQLVKDNELSDKTQLLMALNYQLLVKHHGEYETISAPKKKELATLLRTEAEIYAEFDLPKSLACYLISFFYASGTIDSPQARRINAFLGQTIASCIEVNRLH